jgi:hypothetical protein
MWDIMDKSSVSAWTTLVRNHTYYAYRRYTHTHTAREVEVTYVCEYSRSKRRSKEFIVRQKKSSSETGHTLTHVRGNHMTSISYLRRRWHTLTLLQASTCLRSTDIDQYTSTSRSVKRCSASCPLLQDVMLSCSISPEPLTLLHTL